MAGTRKLLTGVARRLRRDSTDVERKLWRALRDEPSALSRFRRQVPLGSYIADFASHPARLVIELDGGQHAVEANIERDRARSAALALHGYRVLRFWNSDVVENLDGVLDTISRALYDPATPSGDCAAVSPAPNPSPQGGGG